MPTWLMVICYVFLYVGGFFVFNSVFCCEILEVLGVKIDWDN